METPKKTALILIDHGSRLERANQLLEQIVEGVRARGGYPIVAAAHMEIAEPNLATAFAACVQAGAIEVVIVPYFLAEGSHVTHDIPRLAKEAAARSPGVVWKLAEPLGLDERLVDLVLDRATEAGNKVGGSVKDLKGLLP